MNPNLKSGLAKVKSITESNYSIYDAIEVGDKNLWLTSVELEAVLNNELVGLSLKGLPLRTRSKKVKGATCEALGYPIPESFEKTQPRFMGQQFDTYTQKSNNLQVWNEDLDLLRRYVLLRLNENDEVIRVKVVSGSDLAPLDTTGTLTQKYQARLQNIENDFELISESDTENLSELYGDQNIIDFESLSPVENPEKGKILPIDIVYEKLKQIVGSRFPDPGTDQERNRGAALHRLVCTALGYLEYSDDGKFPDVKNQLLEIKLQTSPTIDLGLVSPDSETPLDMEKVNDTTLRHCDVRYAIFNAKIEGGMVNITNLIMTNGRDFYGRLPKFQGLGLNKKIQIPLPPYFFED